MVVWFWKMVDRVQGIICKKVLRICRNVAKVFSMSELDREYSVGWYWVLQQNSVLGSSRVWRRNWCSSVTNGRLDCGGWSDVTETGGKNKFYWTGLHRAKPWGHRKKGHMQHYQTNLCCYQKTQRLAEMRNPLLLYGYWNTPGGERCTQPAALRKKNVVQYGSSWECGNKMSECLPSREGGWIYPCTEE